MTVIVGNPSELSCGQQQVNERNQERRGDDKRQDDLDQRDHGALRSARAAAARRSGRTAGPMRRGRRVSNRRSWRAPLEPFASVGIADACDEKGQGKGQHENVQHGSVPVRRELRAERRRSRLPGLKCHRPHRFSRREGWRRYRNLIKIVVPSFSPCGRRWRTKSAG